MQSTQNNKIIDRRKYYFDIEPDNDLLLWEKWVKIRKEETTALGIRAGRPPVDLTMNLLEKVREDKERKIVLEHAQLYRKPHIRGTLWEQAQRLKQPCYCHPVYEVQRTAEEIGHPRVIEHIGVPDYIQVNEKGLAGEPERKTCDKLESDYKRYRTKREEELKFKIEEIDPFRPNMHDLLIIGKKPKTPPKKIPPLPAVVVTPTDPSSDVSHGIYALRINNTIIVKNIPDQVLTHLQKMQNEPWHEFCSIWTYYFNLPINRVGRAKIYLENLGTVALRYCWKKIKCTIPFIPEEGYEQKFYFYKNEDVISPGQSKEIFLTFVSDRPGIYSESWEFSLCNICLFDSHADKLVFNLQADSIEKVKQISKTIYKLKNKIAKKAMLRIINDLLNDLVINATEVEPEIYPYKKLFLEAELFVMKNPVCFYQQTEVQKLKDTYTEMKPEEPWDLSICTWKNSLMEKEFDDRMTNYAILKKSHKLLLKPWYEGDGLLREKLRAVALLLGQLFDKFYVEHNRISEVNGITIPPDEQGSLTPYTLQTPLIVGPLTSHTIRHIFYLHMYEHVATTIELCAGVLSSLELNRWIEFDFCRWTRRGSSKQYILYAKC